MEPVSQRLLSNGDPAPVEIVNPGGRSPLLLTGDHSGQLIPAALGDLGIAAEDLSRHIGWDIGVDALGRALSARLDAVFVRQRYSRLVIDCNRDPEAASAMPEASDATPIPGNSGLDADARARRVAEIHAPYQGAVARLFDARGDAGVLVALHSFTPSLASTGAMRPWHIGVLHNGGNDGFARRLLMWLGEALLAAGTPLVVGDNEPYRMDITDYTVPRHAVDTGRPYVEIEVRQDLVGDAAGVERIAAILETGLLDAAA